MSAEAPLLIRSWRVGRYTVTLTAPAPEPGAALAAVIEWAPKVPARLSDAELEEYRRGRDAALASLARDLGITVAVVDL